MQQIRSSIHSQWERRGDATIAIAIEDLSKNVEIKTRFVQACASSNLSDGTKATILKKLMEKAFHARVETSLRQYRHAKTDRHADGANDESLRGHLKTLTAKGTKQQAKRLFQSAGESDQQAKKKHKQE